MSQWVRNQPRRRAARLSFSGLWEGSGLCGTCKGVEKCKREKDDEREREEYIKCLEALPNA